jgi:hypothetical protein
MKLSSKVTGALAWAGLAIIIAVPSAEMLTGKPTAKANLTSDMDQMQTASVKLVVKPAVTVPATSEPVKEFVRSGKKLPSYISDVPVVEEAVPVVEEATIKPVPVKKPGTVTINPDGTIAKDTPVAEPKTEVASVSPTQSVIAPTPYPASMRPKAPVAAPLATEAPLIIDENQVAARDPQVILPPADIEPPVITADELDEWDSGSLADYLERKGLMTQSDAAVQTLDSQLDQDGFFLSDGPNADRRSRVRRFEDDELRF